MHGKNQSIKMHFYQCLITIIRMFCQQRDTDDLHWWGREIKTIMQMQNSILIVIVNNTNAYLVNSKRLWQLISNCENANIITVVKITKWSRNKIIQFIPDMGFGLIVNNNWNWISITNDWWCYKGGNTAWQSAHCSKQLREFSGST